MRRDVIVDNTGGRCFNDRSDAAVITANGDGDGIINGGLIHNINIALIYVVTGSRFAGWAAAFCVSVLRRFQTELAPTPLRTTTAAVRQLASNHGGGDTIDRLTTAYDVFWRQLIDILSCSTVVNGGDVLLQTM